MAFPIEIKSLDEAEGKFEGYLAVFGNLDYNGDICEKGCFKKTLIEAKAVQTRTKSAFLYPLLWMHDENNPIGGFTDMYEDSKGLYVKGQCDLDTEMGRRAFSGMQKGYMSQLSIGYQTLQKYVDQKGIRHLTEVKLWEGSAITMGYAANNQANILATKLRTTMRDAKGVSGKATWPLGERDTSWDGGGAHNRIVAWATDDAGKLDQGKMASVHFWYDSDAPDKIGSYKLAFCDIKDGNPVAMPRGIMACAGSHGVDAASIPSSDKTGVKKRISAYYRRMAKEFDDSSLVAPWDEDKAAAIAELEAKGMGGLQALTMCLSNIDYLGDSIDMYLEMLGNATGLDLDPDEGVDDEEKAMVDVLSQLLEHKDSDVQPAVKVLLDNMPGLAEALVAMGQAYQLLDNATDTVLAMMGMEPIDSGGYYGMSADVSVQAKAGRTISAATAKKLKAIATGLMEHKDTLMSIVDGDSGSSGDDTNQEQMRQRRKVNVHKQPELSATTADDSDEDDPEPGDEDDTTLDSLMEAIGEASDDLKLTELHWSIHQ